MIVPTILSELFRAVVVMSIAGGVLTLLLFAIRPLVRHRLPKATQYYLWLVVLVALVIPFSRFVAMPSGGVAAPLPHAFVERNVISLGEEVERLNAPTIIVPGVNWPPAIADDHVPPIQPPLVISPPITDIPHAFFVVASTILMVIYPWIAAAVLLFSIAGYVRFKIRIKRTNIAAMPHETAELARLGGRLRLYRNKTAQTPMLIGIVRPMIVLPDREYTQGQLEAVLLHELTHHRRRDVAIKWLTLLASAVHWFNPLVWLARREIHRACELSCDEAVISKMNNSEKQNYGNTLIEVAADTRLPQSVLSTTMCEEKRALKERLGAIMTNKKHTRLAVFVSVLILVAAAFAACALGAGSGEADDETDDGDAGMAASTYSREDYANAHIESLIATLNVFREDDESISPANIIETQINEFEQVAEFDHILPETIELWLLDFQLLTTDIEDGNIRWGTFAPDSYGWVGQHTGWNDARVLLVFAQVSGGFNFIGYVPWGLRLLNNIHTTWGQEMALRLFLEDEGMLPRVIYPQAASHAFVYIDHGGFEYIRLLMSEIGGIWFVERVHHLGGMAMGVDLHEHFTFTSAVPMVVGDWDGTTAEQVEYVLNRTQQGTFPYSLDNARSAAGYYWQWLWGSDNFSVVAITLVPRGLDNPFAISPYVFGEIGYAPDLSEFEQALALLSIGTARYEIEAVFGETDPNENIVVFLLDIGGGSIESSLSFNLFGSVSGGFVFFTTPDGITISRDLTLTGHVDRQHYPPLIGPDMWHPVFSREPQHLALREQVMAQIGGLAFNEAYMFALGDGTYALITGWRPLTSGAELNRYFPHINLPDQIGDFTLRRITVENGGIADGMWIYRDRTAAVRMHPLYGESFWPPEPTPVNQIFTMFGGLDIPPPMWAFYALFEDSAGNFVGLTAQMSLVVADNEWWASSGIPFTTSSTDPNLHFRGEGNAFYFASLEGLGPMVRLSVRGNPHDLSLDHQWFDEDGFGLIPTDLTTLEELAQIFDLRGLLEQFNWDLTHWQ